MPPLNYGPKEVSKVVYGHRISVMNAAARAAFLKSYGRYRPPVSFTLPNSCGALAGLIWIPFQGGGTGYETLAGYIGKSVFRDHAVLARLFLPGQVCIATTRYIEDAAAALSQPLVKLLREPPRWLTRGSLAHAGPATRSFHGIGSDPMMPGIPTPQIPGYVPTAECDARVAAGQALGNKDLWLRYAAFAGAGLVLGIVVGR